MAKIAILASFTESLVNFRGDMIRDWVERGHEVYTCAPEKGHEKQIKDLGATFTPIRLKRTGMSPINDAFYFWDLVNFFRTAMPDIVFSYTIKPVIYGSFAASFCSIPAIFSMITGAGFAFENGINPFLKRVLYVLYRAALSKNKGIIFQNPDDIKAFKNNRLVDEDHKIFMVNGSGVNLDRFPFTLPETKTLKVILMCRLIPEKGVREYANAAREVKKMHGEIVEFGLLGPYDERPGAISKEEVFSWEREGIVKYYGQADDVRLFLEKSSVFVLPSYYREGVPRSSLEAMAMGRAIITTDLPGCRETVINGVNGFLVPPKDSSSLAKAIQIFIDQPELIHRMGLKSRELAEKKFDVKLINQDLVRILDL